MSLWGVHVGVAGIVTVGLLVRSDRTRRQRWRLILASGTFAVVPDFHHFLPWIQPWYRSVVHNSLLADLFWFHRVIDRLDPRDSPLLSATMGVAFLLVFAATELWVHRQSDRR